MVSGQSAKRYIILRPRALGKLLHANREGIMRNVIAALLLLTAFPAAAQNNEKLFSTDLNVRTILSFKVSDAVVQRYRRRAAGNLRAAKCR
jgi:hypothetical protein